MTSLTQDLGSQAAFLFALLWIGARSPLQEAAKAAFRESRSNA
jgi:hypothetical protein